MKILYCNQKENKNIRNGGKADLVSLDGCVSDLSDDNFVGEPDNQPIFGSVILVLVLDYEPLSGVVVSLTLPSSSILDLVPLEVGLVLDNLDETHGCYDKTEL